MQVPCTISEEVLHSVECGEVGAESWLIQVSDTHRENEWESGYKTTIAAFLRGVFHNLWPWKDMGCNMFTCLLFNIGLWKITHNACSAPRADITLHGLNFLR